MNSNEIRKKDPCIFCIDRNKICGGYCESNDVVETIKFITKGIQKEYPNAKYCDNLKTEDYKIFAFKYSEFVSELSTKQTVSVLLNFIKNTIEKENKGTLNFRISNVETIRDISSFRYFARGKFIYQFN